MTSQIRFVRASRAHDRAARSALLPLHIGRTSSPTMARRFRWWRGSRAPSEAEGGLEGVRRRAQRIAERRRRDAASGSGAQAMRALPTTTGRRPQGGHRAEDFRDIGECWVESRSGANQRSRARNRLIAGWAVVRDHVVMEMNEECEPYESTFEFLDGALSPERGRKRRSTRSALGVRLLLPRRSPCIPLLGLATRRDSATPAPIALQNVAARTTRAKCVRGGSG